MVDYITKSLEEFITCKLRRRSCGDMSRRKALLRLNLSYFWARNERTAEKEAFAKEFMSPREYREDRYYQWEAMVRGTMRNWRYRHMYPFLQRLGFKRDKILE